MLLTFSLLGLSICAAFVGPVRLGKRLKAPLWPFAFIGALIAGLVSGHLAWPALVWLGALAITAYIAGRADANRPLQIIFMSLTVLLALALALHLLPGFRNPVLVANIKFSPDAAPFTQYANFDKAAVGLILLAFLANRSRSAQERRSVLLRALPIAAITAATVIAAGIVAGYVRPDLKLSWYTPVFLATNLLFVCVAEEAFFRGLIQEQLGRLLSGTPFGAAAAVVISALLFGVAHLAGGIPYAGIATLAGLGYAFSYAVTKRIEAPILVHFGVNAVHFIGFTYPRIQ
ncbi:MAG TPA: CPBP family intramembrane glutamic endopeptidase [Noviherbaspirillum sp.]|nr:CPBP family intramembrane glutamic endopeptidase [Noviherbaspirillum sp.]